jgi:hypothetical protein
LSNLAETIEPALGAALSQLAKCGIELLADLAIGGGDVKELGAKLLHALLPLLFLRLRYQSTIAILQNSSLPITKTITA